MDDELKLNRFRKQDGRLLLESYGSCEVPAGCGGLVLRWVRQDAPIHVHVRTFTHAQARLSIDGTELSHGRAELTPGRHVLGVTLTGVDKPSDAVLVASIKAEHRRMPPIVPPAEQWQWRTTEPADGWDDVEGSDEGWLAAREAPAPEPRQQFHEYLISGLQDEGAIPAGIHDIPDDRPWLPARLLRELSGSDTSTKTPGTVWYRLRFDLRASA
ncbi:MAG: hypothetical protein AAF533_22770 [Acidobacteriota bacterium]